MDQPHQQAIAELRALAMSYPQTKEDFPWGHSAFKVKSKTFLFLTGDEKCLRVSLKLPESAQIALLQPFAKPTGYGLGKSGWVTAEFRPKDHVPLDLLAGWLEESFRAIAPKKLADAARPAMHEPEPEPMHPPAKKRRKRPPGGKKSGR